MPAYVRRLSPLVKIQRAQVVKFKRAPTLVGGWSYLMWVLVYKPKRASITIYPKEGLKFNGNSLPFRDVPFLGVSTANVGARTGRSYVYAESGGQEIKITRWLNDDAQARALIDEIKSFSGVLWK